VTLAKAVEELKEMVDKLLAQVTPLEAQTEIMSGINVDQSTELWAKELILERTTTANDDMLHKNNQLTKKFESTWVFFSRSSPLFLLY
jgi:hypothetical protein